MIGKSRRDQTLCSRFHLKIPGVRIAENPRVTKRSGKAIDFEQMHQSYRGTNEFRECALRPDPTNHEQHRCDERGVNSLHITKIDRHVTGAKL